MTELIFLICGILLIHDALSQIKVDYLFMDISIVSMNEETVLENKTVVIKNGEIVKIENNNSSEYIANIVIEGRGKSVIPTLPDAHPYIPFERKELESYFKDTNAGEFDLIKILIIKNDTLFGHLNQFAIENNLSIASHYIHSISDDIFLYSYVDFIKHLNRLIVLESILFQDRVNKLKLDNIFICPVLFWYSIDYGRYTVEYMAKQRGMELINGSIAQEWEAATRRYRSKVGDKEFVEGKDYCFLELQEKFKVLKYLSGNNINLLISPDTSSKFIVPRFGILVLEEMKLDSKAELSNCDILRSVTVNFGYYFKDESIGTIQKGTPADFIFLRSNPPFSLTTLENIEGLFFKIMYFDKEELDQFKK